MVKFNLFSLGIKKTADPIRATPVVVYPDQKVIQADIKKRQNDKQHFS